MNSRFYIQFSCMILSLICLGGSIVLFITNFGISSIATTVVSLLTSITFILQILEQYKSLLKRCEKNTKYVTPTP